MASFSGGNGAFTPNTANDNWTLEADTAGDVGFVEKISWSGKATSATAYRTRWCRPSTNASSTFTSLNPQAQSPGAAALCRLGTFATQATLPTDPANLHAVDWLDQGGGGEIVFPINGRWMVVASATAGHQQISCRNTTGAVASTTSYGVQWAE
jgi:hypothetical protein